jgi:hypothetical protein
MRIMGRRQSRLRHLAIVAPKAGEGHGSKAAAALFKDLGV